MDNTKVESILNAARSRFAHYGLGKTTMNEIAADIGMSKASLYYYFPDKDKIFIAVVEQDISEFVSVIEGLIERPSKPSFKIKKYVSLRNELLVKLFNLNRIENPSPTDLFNPIYDDLKAKYFNKEKLLLERILQLGIDENEFIRFPVGEYADLLLSALVGLRTNALTATGPMRKNIDSIRAQSVLFVDLFLKAIRI